MEKLLPRSTLVMNSCENTGLLKPYGSTSTKEPTENDLATAQWEDTQYRGIPANQTATVVGPFMSGYFASSYMHPVHSNAMVIELTLVNT